MFEELLEIVLGPIGIVAAVAAVAVGTPKGKQALRNATREVVKGGLVAGEYLKDVGERMGESVADIVAEAREEVQHNGSSRSNGKKLKVAHKSHSAD